MKKLLVIAAAMLLAATGANAQEGYDNTKHEVAVGYGILSNSQWLDIFAEVAVMEAGATFSNENFVGTCSAEYLYRATNWLGLGCIFAFGQSSMDYTTQASGPREGFVTNRYFSLMPAVKLDWLRTKYFGMYSKLAVGYTYRTIAVDYEDVAKEDVNDHLGHLNWQASLLGIEAGGPQLRGYLEAGVGEQGVAIVGLRYKF